MDASDFFPDHRSLPDLRQASRGCQGCELYKMATQTVFGEGPQSARVCLVGEQPGNDEDLDGRPFVGPAGRLLDQALEEAGIERSDAYVTNVVKHFRWVAQGNRRLHKKPGARQIAACRPWLDAELALLEPQVLVLLGATAAQALLGRDFRVTESRGQVLEPTGLPKTLATVHPSSILRQLTPNDRRREMGLFIEDLRTAASDLRGRGEDKVVDSFEGTSLVARGIQIIGLAKESGEVGPKP